MARRVIWRILILVLVAGVFFAGGFGVGWFFIPCPKENCIVNIYGFAGGIKKGLFNEPNDSKWMTWENFKKDRNEKIRGN